ncbi:S41 family peptidase [Aspergillus stella-maris]|uniref:S41 family peptidase n=1 Tax=Aspergillus stella-maris TaxID=1810926 RepID=UPI003CCD1A97
MEDMAKFSELKNWFSDPPLPQDPRFIFPPMTPKTRHLVTERMIAVIQESYLRHRARTGLCEQFRKHASGGAYDNITDGWTLANKITSDLQSLSKDKHFRCIYEVSSEEPNDKEQRRRLEKMNYGFGDVHRLPGNIASIEISRFVPVHWSGVKERIGGIMSSIAGADAIIIDLRENCGGDPQTVAFIASYLLDDAPSVCSQTKSAGGDLAYSLQARKRAVVVGETTTGAANLPRAWVLNDGFVLFVPHMEVISPVTGSSWEGVGVRPDVDVPAENALEIAYRLARNEVG